jgi:hypothetical protein
MPLDRQSDAAVKTRTRVAERGLRSSPRALAAMAALFAFGLVTQLNTVLNNAYHEGSTLYDSTIFQTIIWRSGWALRPAPTIGDVSYLNIHFSPINYLPSATSYLIPLDRMSYYGLVYGCLYGALLVLAFRALYVLARGSVVIATIGAVLFYLSGPVSSGAWEPHQEIASALFTIGFFLALAAERQRIAWVMLVLNATVREDCGLLLALPLLALWLCSRWTDRREALGSDRQALLHYAGASVLLAVAAFTVKRLFFHQVDIVADFYFGPDPFSHLSWGLLAERLRYTLLYLQFVWLPGIVLAAAALWLRDPRLIIGWIAFAPYWLINFISKGDFNAQLISYKPFPFILTMLWPTLIACAEPTADRRRLGIIQIGVLLSTLVAINDNGVELLPPLDLEHFAEAWFLQPETGDAPLYRAFEARLAGDSLGFTSGAGGA